MQQIIPLIAIFGTAVFAASGALAGLRNRLDIIGVVFVATLTGIGGGTVRDLLLGATPLSWVASPKEVILCVIVAIGVVAANRFLLGRRLMALTIADAIGLSVFAVLGAAKAIDLGAHPFIAILLGAMTASFGGLIRDVICNETPVFLQREIYITAALAGSAAFVLLPDQLAFEIRVLLASSIALVLRLLAIRFNWSLPFPRYDVE